MQEINNIKVIASKGIVNDRYFKDNNDKDTQITLIESENIDHFNEISGTNFVASDFRRNIITKGIRLNDLINKKIKVGEVNMLVHRLCDPCKYLQDLLSQKNLVKNLLNKGGLRCEVLTSGEISIEDKIIIL
tara:strand:+ start:1962 stop:2357 length:396 start_codon:yes stop_codon:yes gene_type:complete